MNNIETQVFVIAEQGERGIQPVSLQLVGKARTLADELDTHVGVVLLGQDLSNDAKELIAAGADVVYLGDSNPLVPYQAELYVEIIVKLVQEQRPEILLIGSTFMGRELAPLIAARLKTGLTAHCIDLVLNEDAMLEQKVPAYGGLITIVCPKKRPQMATIANGVFPTPKLDSTRPGEIIMINVPEDFPMRVKTLEIVSTKEEGISLESAALIVAGGIGAEDYDGWQKIKELAEVLNAGLGSTRPVVDEGWAELETMIGQSGKIVNPEVYIGVGLSGELQHMVGIIGAKLMIAINNDPKAPVFDQVDYGVVEDCRVFVPELVKALKTKKLSPGE
jgi:electron transfer flavoprotein alpha subunit